MRASLVVGGFRSFDPSSFSCCCWSFWAMFFSFIFWWGGGAATKLCFSEFHLVDRSRDVGKRESFTGSRRKKEGFEHASEIGSLSSNFKSESVKSCERASDIPPPWLQRFMHLQDFVISRAIFAFCSFIFAYYQYSPWRLRYRGPFAGQWASGYGGLGSILLNFLVFIVLYFVHIIWFFFIFF